MAEFPDRGWAGGRKTPALKMWRSDRIKARRNPSFVKIGIKTEKDPGPFRELVGAEKDTYAGLPPRFFASL